MYLNTDNDFLYVERGDLVPRVELGIQFLNNYEHGWLDKINLDRLDMGHEDWCILSQLAEEEYEYAVATFELGGDEPWNLGFYVPNHLPYEGETRMVMWDEGYPILTDIWREKITELRANRTSAS